MKTMHRLCGKTTPNEIAYYSNIFCVNLSGKLSLFLLFTIKRAKCF